MKILLIGAEGRFGRMIKAAILPSSICTLQAEIGSQKSSLESDIAPHLINCDVIIDASTTLSLESNLPKILSYPRPLIICTTGHSEKQLRTIKKASKTIPIVLPPNLPPGLRSITRMLQTLAQNGEFHIEDLHHKDKKDAPSGTALTLSEHLPNTPTFSSKREGNAIATHTIIASYPHETIEIKHTAHNLDLFAESILETCSLIQGKPAGLYDSSGDLLNV